jgi:glycosyltransferase involved in cell wall biosynthesis
MDRHGVPVTYFRRRKGFQSFFAPALTQALSQHIEAFDLVHVHGMWSFPVVEACKIARQMSVPYVISPRGMLMPWELRHKAWKKLPYLALSEYYSLRRCAGIHCTSETEVAEIERLRLGGRCFIIPNAIDLAEFQSLPKRGVFREARGLDGTLALFLGRLHPKKGIKLTLEAFARVAVSHPDLQLVLAGPDEGNYNESISMWATQHGFAERVHVVGPLVGHERLAAYADADLFVLLSESENFATSVAEAMASSLPVLLTPGVGISSTVKACRAGIVVEPTVEAATRGLASLLDHPVERQSMAERARSTALQTYSTETVGAAMCRQYEHILHR